MCWSYHGVRTVIKYRTALLNAFVLTIMFVSMYGELRTGFVGSGTLLFGLIVWLIWLEEQRFVT